MVYMYYECMYFLQGLLLDIVHSMVVVPVRFYWTTCSATGTRRICSTVPLVSTLLQIPMQRMLEWTVTLKVCLLVCHDREGDGGWEGEKERVRGGEGDWKGGWLWHACTTQTRSAPGLVSTYIHLYACSYRVLLFSSHLLWKWHQACGWDRSSRGTCGGMLWWSMGYSHWLWIQHCWCQSSLQTTGI